MTNNKVLRALEVIWFTLGVLTLIAGIHHSMTWGIKNSSYLFILSLIAFAMFLFRRKLRKAK